jgi:hypothetical protein
MNNLKPKYLLALIFIVLVSYFVFDFSVYREQHGVPSHSSRLKYSGDVHGDGFNDYYAVFDSEFDYMSAATLERGASSIVGKVYTNKLPVKGLKLRLALTSNAFTSWVITNNKGEYRISVPTGDYGIIGFELDRLSADKLLKGKIFVPMSAFIKQVVYVDGETGIADMRFVDSIRLTSNKIEYGAGENVSVTWSGVSDAYEYWVQLYYRPQIESGKKAVFRLTDKPKTQYNKFDFGSSLRRGYYYVSVQARDIQKNIITTTPTTEDDYDFVIY